MQARVLESEAMLSEAEVVAYDGLVRKYMQILHSGFVETIVNMSPPGGTFLDVGTGTGWIAVGVAKLNPQARVTGVDLSETMLAVAGRNAAAEGVAGRTTFRLGDAKGLPFEDESFDAVFCHNMLHHIPEPIHLVREMARVVKKDGALVVRDLKRLSELETFLHVNVFGLTYTPLMKKEYRDSIRAALSEGEWKDLFEALRLPGSRLTRQFITHMSLERPSPRRRRDRLTVPVPLTARLPKQLYVSRP